MRDEEQIERDIQAINPTPNRLTPEHIDSMISDVLYYRFPGMPVVVCCLVLKNGFGVVGMSAAVDQANFDAVVGRKLAYQNAREKIWELEGYLLKEIMHSASMAGKTHC